MIISAQKIRPYINTSLCICFSELLSLQNALTLRKKYCTVRKNSDAFDINRYHPHTLPLKVLKHVLRCAKSPTLSENEINPLNNRLLIPILTRYGAQNLRRLDSDSAFTCLSACCINTKQITVRKISDVLNEYSYLPYLLLFKLSNILLRCAKNPTTVSSLFNSQIICTLCYAKTHLRCAEYMCSLTIHK